MSKGIIVHKCFSIDMGEPLPPRKSPRRAKGLPKYSGRICKCREKIPDTVAEELVRQGLAQWMGDKQIAVSGRTKQTPRCATIEKAHMERAYIDLDEGEQARIQEYGLLTLLTRVQVGRYYTTLKTEPENGRDLDWGRPILISWDDERT